MRWVDFEIANLGFLTQDSMWGSRIYPYLPHGWFSQFEPSHPSRVSYFPIKSLAFETPHTLRISSDHPWGGYVSIFKLIISFYLLIYNVNDTCTDDHHWKVKVTLKHSENGSYRREY